MGRLANSHLASIEWTYTPASSSLQASKILCITTEIFYDYFSSIYCEGVRENSLYKERSLLFLYSHILINFFVPIVLFLFFCSWLLKVVRFKDKGSLVWPRTPILHCINPSNKQGSNPPFGHNFSRVFAYNTYFCTNNTFTKKLALPSMTN